MFAKSDPEKMSVPTYLEWESRQEIRYELVNGEVFAMSGGSVAHNDIAINLLIALRPQIRDRACRINIADVKVNTASTSYRYPDLVVSCDERDRNATDAIRYPKLIIEVLSPATEALDRGEKFREYRNLSSLEEYVLVSSTNINVEIYRRGEGQLWLYRSYHQTGEMILFSSVGYEFPIEAVYESVNLG